MDALFFIGSQLVGTSHTGKVGVWNSMTQHWQVCSIIQNIALFLTFKFGKSITFYLFDGILGSYDRQC